MEFESPVEMNFESSSQSLINKLDEIMKSSKNYDLNEIKNALEDMFEMNDVRLTLSFLNVKKLIDRNNILRVANMELETQKKKLMNENNILRAANMELETQNKELMNSKKKKVVLKKIFFHKNKGKLSL